MKETCFVKIEIFLRLLFNQLQLNLSFSHLQEILSTYNDFLFIFAKYIFLFETTSPKPASIKPTHTKFETLCSTQDPARDGVNWYGYCGQNPLTYVDPDGRDIKGAFRGLANMVSAGFEVTGGIFLMGCAAAGEIGSVALATPVAVSVGVVGFAAFVDGVANFGFAAADFTVELVDCFTDDISVDGDLLPANIGGAIGSGIDQNNGFDIQTENKKGPVQVKGENINGVVSLGLTTSAYLGSVVESVSTQAPASKSQVINEVSHQYDIYNNTKLIVEKEE